MSAFSAAVDVIFADANMALAAVYTPGGGDPVAVRVIRQAPVEEFGFDQRRISSEVRVYRLRRSEVASPAPGDRLVCDGETRIVQGQPELDSERLVWTLDTRPG